MPRFFANDLGDTMQAKAQARGYTLDAQQRVAIGRLGQLAEDLTQRRLFRRGQPRSLYLWGPVGRGKSFVLDTFFESVPIKAKQRVHFHAFFRQLHEEIFRRAGSRTSMEDALQALLGGCRLLCFDEFHLHDIGDAMLISRVFKALFARDCVLVTTSNYPPAELLPNPLYHERFLPTIRLIEAHMDVLAIAGDTDYRQLANSNGDPFNQGAFISPGSPEQRQQVGIPEYPTHGMAITLNHRQLQVGSIGEGTVHVSFADICDAPTATMDYLALVQTCSRWIIDAVPPISTTTVAAQQRFLNLVDVLYDNRCTLFMISQWPLDGAIDRSDIADIVRTRSRLSQLRQICA